MDNTIIAIIAFVLILAGTAGSVLPFLPGLPVAWVGLLIYGFAEHFSSSMILALVVFAILIGITMIVDVFAPALAAKGNKASKTGTWGAIIGGLLGIFIFGPLGILIGPFLGGFIGEMISHSNTDQAFKVAWASMYGLVIGSAFKLLIGTSMLIYFVIHVL